MKLITIEQARLQVKSDGDDDSQLTIYCEAAEAACARLANRSIFATDQELNDAIAAIPANMAAAYATYDAAILAADAEDDDRIICLKRVMANEALHAATMKAEADMHGLSLETLGDKGKDIPLAVLMTAATWYANREDVVTGQGAAVARLPTNAEYIMYNHRWHGAL